MNKDKLVFEQMYLTIKAMGAATLEAHGGQTEATQLLEHQLYMLTEVMTPYAVTADEVRQLRSMTGESMYSCKLALEQSRGGMEEAVFILQRGGV